VVDDPQAATTANNAASDNHRPNPRIGTWWHTPAEQARTCHLDRPGSRSATVDRMRRSTQKLVALLATGALALAACGGDGDSDDAADTGDTAAEQTDGGADGDGADSGSDGSDSSDSGSGSDDSGSDDSDGDSQPGFGEFVSGTITLTGAEEMTYTVGDPAFDFIGAGGCGGGQFGVSIQVLDADTGFTAAQVGAGVDADLDGGGTGTFDVDDMDVLIVPDGNLAAGRTYDGTGTMVVSEHDTGGADAVLNERRMAITFDGTVSGTGEAEGDVDVAADVLWVMGCP